MKEDLSKLPKKTLRKMLAETEELRTAIQAELSARKLEEQHDDIDHLDEYLDATNTGPSSLKDFLVNLVVDRKPKK